MSGITKALNDVFNGHVRQDVGLPTSTLDLEEEITKYANKEKLMQLVRQTDSIVIPESPELRNKRIREINRQIGGLLAELEVLRLSVGQSLGEFMEEAGSITEKV